MRVLWLCSSPGLGAELLGVPANVGGGWLASLESAVRRHGGAELSLAFPWDVPAPRRLEGGRHDYLPFPRFPRGGRLRRALHDLSCRLEPAAELDHLRRVVELGRPDLIHVWGTEAFYGLVSEICEQPVLIEIQGLRSQCAAAYCLGLSKLDLLRFGSPRRLLAGRSLLHRYYRYRASAGRERRILAAAREVSGRTRWDRLACAALAPRARYHHCDRVLRPGFYDAAWRGPGEAGETRLVSILRGNAYKGLETVSRAAGLLADLLGAPPRWQIVGIRPGEELPRVVEGKLGVSLESQGIRLLGRRPETEVVRQLEAADVFVHSSWIDNSPNGLCEAMMAGLPVVSTNVGGIPSLLEDEREGLLVPPGDPWAMAGAIRRLAGDPELAARLGAAARRRALGRHDPEAVAETVVGVYRRILDGRHAAPS